MKNLARAKLPAGLIGALLFLPGCGNRYFSDRTTNPVVGDYISQGVSGGRVYGVLSTAATRRSILVEVPADRTRPSRVCAEPPPDAIEAYANAISLAGTGSGGAGAAAAQLELARTLATTSAPMLYRTQGLQFLRDSQYHLCSMYLNGVISPDGYQNLFLRVLEISNDLITQEMEAVKTAANRDRTSIGQAAPPFPSRTAQQAGGAVASGGGASQAPATRASTATAMPP